MSENIVQIRDFQRKGAHSYAKRVNAKADRAFWMGHTGRGDSGVYLTGPRSADKIMAGLEQVVLPAKGYDVGAKVRTFGPDDLTMGRADPEIITADSGDCA